MPEMGAAGAAHHLGAAHAMTAIRFGPYGGLSRWGMETGPTGPGIIISLRTEQFLATTGAAVCAGFLAVVVLAGKGPFRAFLAANAEFFGAEFLAPLRFGSG